MKDKIIVAIDNGVTGTFSKLYPDGTSTFLPTPVIGVRDYTKEVQYCKRVDWRKLFEYLPKENAVAVLERPLVNPKAFVATKSALRALEATIIVLEMLHIPYEFIDSKEWQREFISSGIIGREDLKKASKEIAIKYFPYHEYLIEKHGDGDSLLLALYYKNK